MGDLSGGRIQLICRAAYQPDVGAYFAEFDGDNSADATRRASDDDSLTLNSMKASITAEKIANATATK